MNDAEELTTLDAKEQEIVIEVLKEEQLGPDQIRPLVRKAKELRQGGVFSKGGLKASLRSLQDALKEVHNRLKSKRLHWSWGPHNLQRLLAMPEIRVALEKENIEFGNFLQATAKAEEHREVIDFYILVRRGSNCYALYFAEEPAQQIQHVNGSFVEIPTGHCRVADPNRLE